MAFHANAESQGTPYSIWIQNLYSIQVTQDKLATIVAPLSAILDRPMEVRSTSDTTELENAVKANGVDMVFWGGYKTVEKMMARYHFHVLAKANIDVIIYQYRPTASVIRGSSNIAVLQNSSAWQVMNHHLPDNANVHYFEDYYSIMKGLDEKQIDFVVATPTFLIPMPQTLKKKFSENHRLASFGYAAQWIKAKPNTPIFHKIKQFLREKDQEFTDHFGVRFYPE